LRLVGRRILCALCHHVGHINDTVHVFTRGVVGGQFDVDRYGASSNLQHDHGDYRPGGASPAYAASGTEATFTVTVAPGSGSGYSGTQAPGGTPLVWVCQGSTACAYGSAYKTFTPSALSQIGSTTSSSATVLVTGLAAGTYNINSSYPGGSSTGPIFSSSATSSGTSFTIGQVSTAVSAWTPGATTQQVSAAIGTSVLNATATPSRRCRKLCLHGDVYKRQRRLHSIFEYHHRRLHLSAHRHVYAGRGLRSNRPNRLYFFVHAIHGDRLHGDPGLDHGRGGRSTNVVASDGSGNYTSLRRRWPLCR
jgi:hypothetical protein